MSDNLPFSNELASLGGSSNFRSLSVNAASIESIVNNLSYSGNVGIDIHTITRRKMTKYSLSRNFKYRSG